MLGHVIFLYLKKLKKFKIYSTSKKYSLNKNTSLIDVRDIKKVEKFLYEINPDIVINCTGLLISESEKKIEDSIQINSLLPNILSRLGDTLDFKLIQISTDCVFSGKKGNYIEEDYTDGDSVYARTKILGEISQKNHLTIRTSIIGPELKIEGSGLLNWFLSQKGSIYGYRKVKWTGLTTLELAICIEKLIDKDIFGLIHIIPNEKISKYELLCLFKKIWNKNNINIIPKDTPTSDKSLSSHRKNFRYKFRNYEDMLIELKFWMIKNKKIYKHYF